MTAAAAPTLSPTPGRGLRLTNVSYRYAGAANPTLHDLTLAVEPGAVLGLAGANESGKSTLCLVASGLAPGNGRRNARGVGHDRRRVHHGPQALRAGAALRNPVPERGHAAVGDQPQRLGRGRVRAPEPRIAGG